MALAPTAFGASQTLPAYCTDLVTRHRRVTRTVMVGNVGVGGANPIRVQSMTTTRTQDIAATMAQAERLVRAGCEIVRITAPTVQDARAIGVIRQQLRARGITVPLVADIHFSPAAALEAADHVEKVRINPGNYADSRRFAQRDYTDDEYNDELRRIEERFTPLVRKCLERGIALRIGTNHGSLSDRIVNRYGDTPEGMCESALEFVRIGERLGFHDVILSMKASNPKVMIAAYRLLAARMAAEGMAYPFHLGVTEAGNGEDARIKSAVGIGALLEDGIGDTIRVSLAEEPEEEVPVAAALARRYWPAAATIASQIAVTAVPWDPFHYGRRPTRTVELGPVAIGSGHPPIVLGQLPDPAADLDSALLQLFRWSRKIGRRAPQPDAAIVEIRDVADIPAIARMQARAHGTIADQLPLIARLADPELIAPVVPQLSSVAVRLSDDPSGDPEWLSGLIAAKPIAVWLEFSIQADDPAAHQQTAARALAALRVLSSAEMRNVVIALRALAPAALLHAGRVFAVACADAGLADGDAPPLQLIVPMNPMSADKALLASSIACGSLLCDGLGDGIAIEGVELQESVRLAFSLLQGAAARMSRTDFVACPSCGRTLFDLQSTTDRIKQRTSHLTGVKLAIMGCVVNGPGEMADADFGYVGGSPGHVNLYVGKECVERNVPEAEADERLVQLIRAHGRWVDPEPEAADGET